MSERFDCEFCGTKYLIPGGQKRHALWCPTRRESLPPDCPICAYAGEHGSWPTRIEGKPFRGTHCEFCHRSWTGRRQSHCVVRSGDRTIEELDRTGSTCCLHFAGDQAGDMHRVGDIRRAKGDYPDYSYCLTPEELLAIPPTDAGRQFWVDDKDIWHYGVPFEQYKGPGR